MNEKILKMYFEDKMKQIEIAKELNISKYKVSRVVTKDFRYKLETKKSIMLKLCNILLKKESKEKMVI